MEQGRPFSLSDLSDVTSAALGLLQDTLDARPRDWSRYAGQAAEFHVKNARAWASAAVGEDLALQVAPGFTLGRPTSGHQSRERVPESARRKPQPLDRETGAPASPSFCTDEGKRANRPRESSAPTATRTRDLPLRRSPVAVEIYAASLDSQPALPVATG
jgi:hypothetical protein